MNQQLLFNKATIPNKKRSIILVVRRPLQFDKHVTGN